MMPHCDQLSLLVHIAYAVSGACQHTLLHNMNVVMMLKKVNISRSPLSHLVDVWTDQLQVCKNTNSKPVSNRILHIEQIPSSVAEVDCTDVYCHCNWCILITNLIN